MIESVSEFSALVASVGKPSCYGLGNKGEKTCNARQARENRDTRKAREKTVKRGKRAKAFNLWQVPGESRGMSSPKDSFRICYEENTFLGAPCIKFFNKLLISHCYVNLGGLQRISHRWVLNVL